MQKHKIEDFFEELFVKDLHKIKNNLALHKIYLNNIILVLYLKFYNIFAPEYSVIMHF